VFHEAAGEQERKDADTSRGCNCGTPELHSLTGRRFLHYVDACVSSADR
jgi:hypothetical protein